MTKWAAEWETPPLIILKMLVGHFFLLQSITTLTLRNSALGPVNREMIDTHNVDAVRFDYFLLARNSPHSVQTRRHLAGRVSYLT